MDWSLVLASQDIPTVIEKIDGDRWALVVPSHDLERARSAIQQYRIENRRWTWRRPLVGAATGLHSGALLWCIWIAVVHWMATVRRPAIRDLAQMKSLAVESGEWWRLFTAVHLHGDLAHLLANATTGFLFLGLAMGAYGPGVGLLAAFVCGVIGNIAGLLLYTTPYHGLGASGMVMGGLGLVTAHAMANSSAELSPMRVLVRAALAGILLFVIVGTDPSSDVVAHLGGFVAGLALGSILSRLSPDAVANERVQIFSAIGLMALTSGTIALALR